MTPKAVMRPLASAQIYRFGRTIKFNGLDQKWSNPFFFSSCWWKTRKILPITLRDRLSYRINQSGRFVDLLLSGGQKANLECSSVPKGDIQYCPLDDWLIA